MTNVCNKAEADESYDNVVGYTRKGSSKVKNNVLSPGVVIDFTNVWDALAVKTLSKPIDSAEANTGKGKFVESP